MTTKLYEALEISHLLIGASNHLTLTTSYVQTPVEHENDILQ